MNWVYYTSKSFIDFTISVEMCGVSDTQSMAVIDSCKELQVR